MYALKELYCNTIDMYAKLKKQTKNKKEINAWQIELND